MSVIENLPPGNAELRQAIARRYALQASPFLLMKLSLLPGR
ncbi:transcriptional regulator protein YdcR [Escherichia coli]|uniref:Transcriptional regulator protein YdcR n=1 Tax=Escherichia coli TaxID=562 RepID=A0A376TG46_ECOLX|nr:transcriptional regulator protein YdcR [Escherichia coli]